MDVNQLFLYNFNVYKHIFCLNLFNHLIFYSLKTKFMGGGKGKKTKQQILKKNIIKYEPEQLKTKPRAFFFRKSTDADAKPTVVQ